VLINGALLMFGRKSDAPPAITIDAPAATQSSSGDAPASNEPSTEEAAPPQPRSDVDSAAPQKSASNSFGYGFYNDVLASPYAGPGDEPAPVPSGLTIVEQGPEPEAKIAATYQQQVLAGLSGALGIAAAKSSADALLPDVNGRITPEAPELASLSDAGSAADLGSEASQNAGSSALKLPPATVGPLSLRLAAANGDPSAEFEVASRLAQGKGTDQNLSEAVRWYHRAAAKGFTQAHYRLGTLFERGLGVPKDIGRARVWYQRAAEQGNIKAMHNLAVLSAGGTGEPDYATAISWFTKAAEHGLADSQFNLGVLLENGLGIAQDRAAAYKWYALAAKGGDKDAASRRDALHASFDPEALKNAEAQLNVFKAKPSDPIANDPRVAGEDWKKRLDKEAAASPPDADRNVMGVVQ
jgi:localization factor PodJL